MSTENPAHGLLLQDPLAATKRSVIIQSLLVRVFDHLEESFRKENGGNGGFTVHGVEQNSILGSSSAEIKATMHQYIQKHGSSSATRLRESSYIIHDNSKTKRRSNLSPFPLLSQACTSSSLSPMLRKKKNKRRPHGIPS